MMALHIEYMIDWVGDLTIIGVPALFGLYVLYLDGSQEAKI